MKKNKKQDRSFGHNMDLSAHARVYPVDFPNIANIDELAVVSDDTLFARINDLERDRKVVMSEGLDTRSWEIELAYARRESQIRRTRSEAHERYLDLLDEQDAASVFVDEDDLPSADLDNTQFTRLFWERNN